MKRIGIACLLTLATAATLPHAHAGDGAALNVLGFSPDGRHFAFEQYGAQDGSGSLYSIITAIQIAGDKPAKGMPITAIMDPDNPSLGKAPRDQQLAEIRAKAAAAAAPILRQLNISEAGQMVMSTRDAHARSILNPEQVRAAEKAAVATVNLPAEDFGSDARLVLREFDIAVPRCKDLPSREHPSGFGLTLERKGRPTIHLNRDQTIPPSRRCPEHYGIAEAHALPLADGSMALAVVIHYFYQAFEGPDRRFLAVTGRVAKH
jgi:predicted secreted protein